MNKKVKIPMALSPLVALAEQASDIEAAHAVLLVRTATGERGMYPLDSSDPDILAGLMAWGASMIFSADLEDDDDEDLM
jgi:hypothetical protein